MASFKLPPAPPEDPTNPEGNLEDFIPTRLNLGEEKPSASRTSASTPLEIPLARQVDTIVAATHRGFLDADRRCEERLAGAQARGWRVGMIWGALGGVAIFVAGILLYKFLRR